MNGLLRGAISGLAATLPMTIAMEVMHRRMGLTKRYALPPRQITAYVARSLGIRDRLGVDEERVATMVSHFGYGGSMGVPYALAEESIHLPPIVKGAGYGLAVWAGSYLGLLPRLGLLSPATRHPPQRTALMIAAHLVWGSAMAIAVERLKRRRGQARGEASPASPVSQRSTRKIQPQSAASICS
jgi:hypothetical protein